jgi:hypothetical protein
VDTLFTGTVWIDKMRAAVAATYEDPRTQTVRKRHLGTFGGAGLPALVEAMAYDLLGLRTEQLDDVVACAGRFESSSTAMLWRLHGFDLAEPSPPASLA